MASLIKDTHGLVTFLQTQGYSRDQAEAFNVVLREHVNVEELSTKSDIKDLKIEIYKAMGAQALIIIGAVIAVVQLTK